MAVQGLEAALSEAEAEGGIEEKIAEEARAVLAEAGVGEETF